MNRFSRILFGVVALAALAIATPAFAQQTEVRPVPLERLYWESGSVASGAVINTPVFDTRRLDSILICADNSAGAAGRNLVCKAYLDDGTTAIYTYPTVAISNTAPGQACILLYADVSSATAPTLTTLWPVRPPHKFGCQLAAGGAAAAAVTVQGR